MIPQTRKYFLIIVHFGDNGPTNALLTDLSQNTVQPDCVIVINNNSDAYLPPANINPIILNPQTNSGYAGGINMALGWIVNHGAAAEDIVISLNNDTRLTSNALEQIQVWWKENPTPTLVGTKGGAVNYITGRAVLKSGAPQKKWYTTPYIDGACLIAPLKVWLDSKGLSETGFMYWEDVALSVAAHKQGYPLHVVPDLGITHAQKNPNSTQLYYLVRSGARTLEQSPSVWRWYWRIGNTLRRFYHHLLHPSSIVYKALRDAHQKKEGINTSV